MSKPTTQLIVALDNCNEEQADRLSAEVAQAGVSWLKVGLELYTLTGPAFVKRLKSRGLNVFLDLKLYDIPNTVAQAVKSAADTGADLLTVHCSGGPRMLAAAQEATQGTKLSLLGVTVLTSFGNEDFPSVAEAWGARQGSALPRGSVALKLAEIAAKSGLPGIVCSVSDLHDGQLQKLNWSHGRANFVTPGIRNAGDAANDQKSIATVEQAIIAGSTHMVVGRPITAASDRVAAARSFLGQITNATNGAPSRSGKDA